MFSYGLEIEFIDANRADIILPVGCEFNKKEVTLVNSNGIAVDSTKKSKNPFGGEINTCPTPTLEGQLNVAERCLKLLKKAGAGINYRCNLHSHIGFEDPSMNTVETLKKVQSYAYDNFQDLIMGTMGEGQFNKKPEYPLSFWSHYKERMVPEYKHKMLLESKTLKDFQMTFFKSKEGKHAPMTFMRQLVNTHSFFKTKTIEYRGFWATLDIKRIEHCLKFHQLFIEEAIGVQTPVREYIGEFKFPKELPFSVSLEKGFQATKVKKP